MWYFTWVLGLGLAVAFGILNGMWHEFGCTVDDGTSAGASSASGALYRKV